MNKNWCSYIKGSSIVPVILLLMLLPPLSSAGQKPFFEKQILSGYNNAGLYANAYPVIGRMNNGRLLCVFAVLPDHQVKKLSIAFSTSDDNGIHWSKPVLLFNDAHTSHSDPNMVIDGDRVLVFSTSVTFPKPPKIDSTFIMMRSTTDGQDWTKEVFIKKPHRYICGKIHQGHRLKDGSLIMGYSWDTWAEQRMPASTEGEMNLRSGVLRSGDGGRTWKPGGDLYAAVKKIAPGATSGLGEPATVVLKDGRIMTLMRAGGSKLYQAWSSDGGLSWTAPTPSTLTAHNSPAALWRLDQSGDVLAVWSNVPNGRNALAAALSSDGGKTWSSPKPIARSDRFQVSYPSAVQAGDGTLIAVWQQDIGEGKREVCIARFNRAWLLSREPH
ncbi:sialidase family protein [Niabella aurantiaca]|uniref:sialidase family protein n=1 Tax=Niabella aurantiaca TaxID=379900 RepID=UPI00039A56C8|nr:sialidase family protein [Niabella aurantiaca]